MQKLNHFLKRPVPRAAKIFAVVLLIFNLMAFVSYLSALGNPELLRQAAETMGLTLTQEQFEALIASMPLQMVLSGITIAGLLLILFNRTWGFLLFALSPVLSAVFALASGDLLGMLTGLLPALIMLLFLRTGSAPRPKTIPSNYSYNLPDETQSRAKPTDPSYLSGKEPHEPGSKERTTEEPGEQAD